jgi:hypothetical protein
MLPFPLNLNTPRTWLRPAGGGSDELACGLVVAGQVRWLRARLRGSRVMFDEIEPRTSPSKWMETGARDGRLAGGECSARRDRLLARAVLRTFSRAYYGA